MSPEELKQLIEELKAEGMSEKDIAKASITMFVEGKIELEDLKTFLAAIGYDLKPEVLKQLEENPESFQLDVKEEKSESKDSDKKEENKEESKEEEKSKSKEEFKDSNEKEEKKDEDKEWDEAKKYFHFNK